MAENFSETYQKTSQRPNCTLMEGDKCCGRTIDEKSPRKPLGNLNKISGRGLELQDSTFCSPSKSMQKLVHSKDSGIELSPCFSDRCKLVARRTSISSQSTCSTTSELNSFESDDDCNYDFNEQENTENVSPSALSSLISGPLIAPMKLCSSSENLTPGKSSASSRQNLMRRAHSTTEIGDNHKIGESFKRPTSHEGWAQGGKRKKLRSCHSEQTIFTETRSQRFSALGTLSEDSSEEVGDFDDSFIEAPIVRRPEKRIPLYKSHSESEVHIKNAVEKTNQDASLVGDGSKSHALDLLENKTHHDLKEISPATLVELLEGKYCSKIKSFQIIDCRYPYEFQNGHIQGAINLFTQQQVYDMYIQSKKPKSPEARLVSANHDILIFHCEFSSKRGPAMYRFLREADRRTNSYPSLHYPEIYLLNGGYKKFFEQYPNHCVPAVYVEMADANYIEQLRTYKSKCELETINYKISKKKCKPQPKLPRSTSFKKLSLEPSLSSPLNRLQL